MAPPHAHARRLLDGARGVGHRKELATELMNEPRSVDFLEVVAESCFTSDRMRREIVALAEVWPVVPHGVKLSLGSAEGVDVDRAKRLGALAKEVGAPVVTEHVALTNAGGREIGHLTALPRSAAAIRAVAKNVAVTQKHLPYVPLLLENIAVTFALPADAMSEADFYAEVVRATGCDLLLDVANLYANAVNAGADPVAVARAFPLERVGMIHVAGGVFEDGFYFDTHAHPIPDAVFDVLAAVFERAPRAPVVLERDGGFEGGLAPLVRELARTEALRSTHSGAREDTTPIGATTTPADDTAGLAALASEQAELARILTAAEPPSGALADAIGLADLLRSRGILQRKRVDDALPLLPRLSSRPDIRAVAEAAVQKTPRGPRMQGIADAFGIARLALDEPSLADLARRDLLVLRARFDDPSPAARARGVVPKPRRGPFVAREALASGVVLWAVKGFGADAKVHLREGRAT